MRRAPLATAGQTPACDLGGFPLKKTIALCCLTALVVAGLVPAYGAARHLITSRSIKNHSIKGIDIKKGTIGISALNKSLRTKINRIGTGSTPAAQGQDGAVGPQGPAGVNGVNGVNGSNAAGVVGPHWSIIQRNTEQGGIAQLINGPFVNPNPNGAPPFGQGSLNLETPSPSSKVSFGNQVDFVGDPVAAVNEVGFHVMPTGEDFGASAPRNPNNMPSITFEIDPNNPTGTTTNFASLVFIPKPTPANQWSAYIDGTDADAGDWGLTGSQFNPVGDPATTDARCGINGSRCSWDEVQAYLATGTGASILSVAVTKGKDYQFEGSVDGLRINNQVFDFESYGVETAAP
jgi:hypothetical protein